ncbi:hypothetical protein OG21DRAFT_1007208 [Imleria badia]|nr:hypothetical protein OG21DRAFT_1007208 [Imleria badia]
MHSFVGHIHIAAVYAVFSAAYASINCLSYDTYSLDSCQGLVGHRDRSVFVDVAHPPSSGYTATGLCVASILSVAVKYKLVPPNCCVDPIRSKP